MKTETRIKQSEIAEAFARKAHEGHFRRDGVTPYITHPERVVACLKGSRNSTIGDSFFDLMIATAWLHDTLEDCPEVTRDSLFAAGVDAWVVDHVENLTRKPDVDYDRYLEYLKNSKTERMVKVADILDNLTDEPSPTQVLKYKRALLFLAE